MLMLIAADRAASGDDALDRSQTLSKSNPFRLWERLRAVESVAARGLNARYETHAFDFGRVAADRALCEHAFNLSMLALINSDLVSPAHPSKPGVSFDHRHY